MPQKRVLLAVSLDVEEEGLFRGQYQCRSLGLRNTACLARLEPLLERGIRPTLFCAHSVFVHPPSRAVLNALQGKWPLEIGAHLHHWNTPPLAAD
ncbi:MAG: glycosyl transferase family 1, partial [Desulfovibrionaceae bacterium]|nr:glycosyl transferase family 1 [Desulfovibrionaceae bacterium]